MNCTIIAPIAPTLLHNCDKLHENRGLNKRLTIKYQTPVTNISYPASAAAVVFGVHLSAQSRVLGTDRKLPAICPACSFQCCSSHNIKNMKNKIPPAEWKIFFRPELLNGDKITMASFFNLSRNITQTKNNLIPL